MIQPDPHAPAVSARMLTAFPCGSWAGLFRTINTVSGSHLVSRSVISIQPGRAWSHRSGAVVGADGIRLPGTSSQMHRVLTCWIGLPAPGLRSGHGVRVPPAGGPWGVSQRARSRFVRV